MRLLFLATVALLVTACYVETQEEVVYKCPCVPLAWYTCHCADRDGPDPMVQSGRRYCTATQQLTRCDCSLPME